MKEWVKQDLVAIKTSIVSRTLKQKDEVDYEQLEYMIQLIDYMLLNEVKLEIDVINELMEEIVCTSIYQTDPQILSVLPVLDKIGKDLQYGTNTQV